MISTDFNGFRSTLMNFDGFQAVSMGFDGFKLIATDPHGFPWISMDFQVIRNVLWWDCLIGFPGFPGHEERLCGGTYALVSRDFPVMRSVFVVGLSHWFPRISRSCGASLWWDSRIGFLVFACHEERLCGGTFSLVSPGFLGHEERLSLGIFSLVSR